MGISDNAHPLTLPTQDATGVVGISQNSLGVRGYSSGAQGGVFASENVAPINLVPANTALPVSGQVGDLIVTIVGDDPTNSAGTGDVNFWLCFAPGDGTAAIDQWVPVQFGPSQAGGTVLAGGISLRLIRRMPPFSAVSRVPGPAPVARQLLGRVAVGPCKPWGLEVPRLPGNVDASLLIRWTLARRRQHAGLEGRSAEARAWLRRELVEADMERHGDAPTLDAAEVPMQDSRVGHLIRVLAVARPLPGDRFGVGDPGSSDTLDLGAIETAVPRGTPVEVSGWWDSEKGRLDLLGLVIGRLGSDSALPAAAGEREIGYAIESCLPDKCQHDARTTTKVDRRPEEATLIPKIMELFTTDHDRGRLSLDTLRRANEILLAGAPFGIGGRLRSGSAVVWLDASATFIPPPAGAACAGAMDFAETLARHLRDGRGEVAAAVLAAESVARFTDLHPFADGNGRVARAVATWLLLRKGYRAKDDLTLGQFFRLFEKEHYFTLRHHQADPWSWHQFFFDAVLACFNPPG
jgi:Fic/DOC family